MFFGDRVKWWSELSGHAPDVAYSWVEVRAAERGEDSKSAAPSSSSSAATPAASPASAGLGAGVPPVAPPGGLAVPIAAPKAAAAAIPASASSPSPPSSSTASSSSAAASPSRGEAQLVCAECQQTQPQGSFSKTQLAKGRQRQCHACIKRKQDARRAPQPQARSRVEAKDDEEENDEDGEEDEEDDVGVWFDANPNAFERTFHISSKADGLLNSVAFPRWRNLTEENDPSLIYYTDPSVEGVFRPKRHWTMLGQIQDSQMVGMGFGRNTIEVTDRVGERFRVAFYADQPIEIRPLFKSDGHTIAVRYAEKHWFMDGSVGLRVEDLCYVQVISCSLEQLYQAYAEMQAIKTDECAKCKKTVVAPAAAAASGAGAASDSSSSSAAAAAPSAILSACAACHLTRYCSKSCQQSDWTAEGHKRRCKLFRALQDLLAVPVDAARPTPRARRFECIPFKTQHLIKGN